MRKVYDSYELGVGGGFGKVLIISPGGGSKAW